MYSVKKYYCTLFFSQKVAYSCSAEGTVMVWDVSTLQVSLKPTTCHLKFAINCDERSKCHKK